MSDTTATSENQEAPVSTADAPTGQIQITRTELVWPGKYNADGTRREVPRVNLPFQVIETINESRATREAKKVAHPTLFDIWEGKEGDTFEAGWKNKLIWGDNLLVTASLLEKFAGKINLIYIDPPFATGADFSFATQIGEDQIELSKEQSLIEEKVYRDTWGSGLASYLSMIFPRLCLLRDLLSDSGCIYVHCDWRLASHIKIMMFEAFGATSFMNEIVWRRSTPTGGKTKSKMFPRDYDSILAFRKSQANTFHSIYLPYSDDYVNKFFTKIDDHGRRYASQTLRDYSEESIAEFQKQGRIIKTSSGALRLKQYLDESPGILADDVWTDIRNVRQQEVRNISGDSERLDYPTQKPEAVLDRILRASSNPGDLVADFFVGCGTTLATAEKLGRRWIGCDLSRWAIHLTRKRLLSLQNARPFEVLNLGKYERKYWQGVTFSDHNKKTGQPMAIFQYIAFILKLYGAQPLTGMQHLHGKKGKAMIHVGPVDAPVTIDEVNGCVEEALAVEQKELHVLGWEWEMGLANLMVEEAKRRGVKLLLLNIPREVMEEQAVDKGDIRFFEVAHLEFKITPEKGRKVTVALKDFAFPYADLIPEEVRDKIKKWSDYIDYWAVDWNFQNDTFMNGWVAYRTRKERKLPLQTDHNTYDKPGNYTVMVKVVDIFGNDTSQAFDVEIK